MFYSFSAGIDFRRQDLTTKVDPRTERVNIKMMWFYYYCLQSTPTLHVGELTDSTKLQDVDLKSEYLFYSKFPKLEIVS